MSYPFSGLVIRWLTKDQSSVIDDNSQPTEPGIKIKNDDCSSIENKDTCEAAIHVNLWDLSSEICLDVGVLFQYKSNLNALIIDLPWEVHKCSFLDLAPRLGSSRVLMAIFNENIDLKDESGSRFAHVEIKKQSKRGSESSWKENFKLTQLDINSCEFQHFNINNRICTRLKVTMPIVSSNLRDGQGVYIRFRLNKVPDEVFFTEFKPKDRHLLSSNQVTRLLDLIALGRFLKKLTSTWQNIRFMVLIVLLGALGSGLWALAIDLSSMQYFSDYKEEIVIIFLLFAVIMILYVFRVEFIVRVLRFLYYLPSKLNEGHNSSDTLRIGFEVFSKSNDFSKRRTAIIED